MDVIDHSGGRGDQVQRRVPFQPFLDHLHVQHPEEAAPEPETKGLGSFRFESKGGVV